MLKKALLIFVFLATQNNTNAAQKRNIRIFIPIEKLIKTNIATDANIAFLTITYQIIKLIDLTLVKEKTELINGQIKQVKDFIDKFKLIYLLLQEEFQIYEIKSMTKKEKLKDKRAFYVLKYLNGFKNFKGYLELSNNNTINVMAKDFTLPNSQEIEFDLVNHDLFSNIIKIDT